MTTMATSVRRNRAHNLKTGRLLGRRMHLVLLLHHGMRDIDSRAELGHRVGELWCIENVLCARGVLRDGQRVTPA